MDLKQAMESRHSVRQYKKQAIAEDVIAVLQEEIAKCNEISGLNMQLVTNEEKAFDGFMAHYGKFSNVSNYIALVGKKDDKLDELCGYYGEQLVLKAQQLGLNSCWVALTYKKVPGVFKVEKGEKLAVVIALGYGETAGVQHKSKTMETVSNAKEDSPQWFKDGVQAALLAPTAMNQQKFYLTLEDKKVSIKAGMGFYSKVDLGIVKYHFEIGAGKENFEWA